MPKAEAGTLKHLNNKMKAKGLQRLRWYCQICEKQCRDENGFKQHTLSEGHVRSMLLVGEDPKKFISKYSNQFQRDFLQLLRTSHGEKKVHMNQFYQEYIRDKEHVHMNATRWPSLTEFAKFLGREGMCRVEEGERGLEIAWIDDSPEAVRRREDIKRKDRLMKGDEDVESRLLEEQIRRAKEATKAQTALPTREEDQQQENQEEKEGKTEMKQPVEPVKVSGFSLKSKAPAKSAPTQEDEEAAAAAAASAPVAIETFSAADQIRAHDKSVNQTPAKLSLGGLQKKPVNPLAAKKNPFAKPKVAVAPEPEKKKISNAERIMKEEMERKRWAEERGGDSNKRQRLG